MLTPIAEFVRSLLAHRGALVERDGTGLSAMIPADLAATLDVQEYQRLIFDPLADANGGLRVDYDSPLLERLGHVVEQLGHVGWMPVAPPPLKTIDPGAEVARALTVGNGVVRNCRAQQAEALYVGFFVEYALLADERVSGLLELWVNATMRSLPRLDGLLARAAGIDHEIRRRARRALAKRDAEGAQAEASRLEATAHAYRSRATDLVDRYRVRVRLSPLGAVACTLTVHEVTARLHRRSASRDVRLAWNPLDRGIETPCCEGCGHGVTTATLCDERVHLLCER